MGFVNKALTKKLMEPLVIETALSPQEVLERVRTFVAPIPMVLVPFLVAIGLFVWVAEKVGDSKRKNERRRSTGQIRQR